MLMPLHCCCCGESSRPSENPVCEWIRRKVEAQGERKNCFAHKISWLQPGKKKKEGPLPSSHSSRPWGGGGLVFAAGWTRREAGLGEKWEHLAWEHFKSLTEHNY